MFNTTHIDTETIKMFVTVSGLTNGKVEGYVNEKQSNIDVVVKWGFGLPSFDNQVKEQLSYLQSQYPTGCFVRYSYGSDCRKSGSFIVR